jgi:hypothetical protein
MRVSRTALSAAILAALAACSSPQSAQERAASAEIASVAPLKTKYAGIVMGFDVGKDSTLLVSVDVQAMVDSMGDYEERAMLEDALARWRSAWLANHPHERATLHVRFIDFRGNTLLQGSIDA